MMLPANYTTFKMQSSLANELEGMANQFMFLLDNHGEVMVVKASGETWSVHLGDRGYLDNDKLCFIEQSGQHVVISWSQVEGLWTHLASKE